MIRKISKWIYTRNLLSVMVSVEFLMFIFTGYTLASQVYSLSLLNLIASFFVALITGDAIFLSGMLKEQNAEYRRTKQNSNQGQFGEGERVTTYDR